MIDLSIIVPSRNEMFLARTVRDLLQNIRGNTEIIVVLDGQWADPPIADHPKVTLIHHSESVGQRGATNEAARLSRAKYLVKCDAHCAFDEGFDVKMMEAMQPNWTMVPMMRSLHVFDWVCKKCGDRRYQGNTPTECPKCDNKTEFERDVVWIAKTNPQCSSYCFDPEPHFQYFRDFKKRPEGRGDITPTMSLQGSFFMCTREKYFELNLCDEEFGSWGSQGIEVAVKTWLSGGQVMCNKKTWYAHLFRTKGADFGFPWPASGRQIQGAKKHAKELFFNNKWEKQKYPLNWLVEKFWPVPGWTDADLAAIKGNVPVTIPPPSESEPIKAPPESLSKGIVYYSDNRIDPELAKKVQESIKLSGLPIVSVSLKPLDFGTNIVLDAERGYLTMFRQMLKGIEAMKTDILFFCEHDVIYTREHFDFIPPEKDKFYYNKNSWMIRQKDGFAVYWDCKKVSQICVYRDLALRHYTERVRRVEAEGFTRRMGFEPGTHGRVERVDDCTSEWFETSIPNLDIRHRYNLTGSRWSPSEFTSLRRCRNWKESHLSKLPGWEGIVI
jgi:glycosyltransferase involved in cell wall biosynthesis